MDQEWIRWGAWIDQEWIMGGARMDLEWIITGAGVDLERIRGVSGMDPEGKGQGLSRNGLEKRIRDEAGMEQKWIRG